MRKCINFAGLVLLAGTVASSSAFATTVGAGSFSLSGTAVGSATGINFYLMTPGDQKASVNLPTTGVFALPAPTGLAPTTVETIRNLDGGVTPGTPFNFTNWIQLTDGINLDATSIPIPTFGVCGSGPVAVGFQCRPDAASPVVLTQSATGVQARLGVMGNAHFVSDPTLTPFTALFTAPSTPYATIADFEAAFNANGGSIPAVSYSASFDTTPTAGVPEPAAIFLASAGLVALGLVRRRKSSL